MAAHRNARTGCFEIGCLLALGEDSRKVVHSDTRDCDVFHAAYELGEAKHTSTRPEIPRLPMGSADPKKLRRRGRQLLDKCELIVRLTVQNTPEEMARIAAARSRLDSEKNRDLPQLVKKIETNFNDLAEKVGFAVPDSYVPTFLDDVRKSTRARPAMFSKWRLKQALTKCEALLPMLDKERSHTCVMLDSKVQHTETMASVEFWTLEFAIYEHMAGVYNTARRLTVEIQGREQSKEERKTLKGLSHSCVVHSFFFLEAYLNGIAFDHLASHEDSLTPDNISSLSEWDSEKEQRRLLTFRDKLLQYPKIVAGLDHPPLQENNCPELEFMVQRAKLWRDSIVHASPLPELATLRPIKEMGFIEVNFPEAEETVDTVIRLVQLIHAACGKPAEELACLLGRGNDGFFPPEAFA